MKLINKLEIKNLYVNVENKEILKGIDLTFETGKTYAVIGPNGHGKSTLLSTIMGDPNYLITDGEVNLNDEIINNWEVDKRAVAGIFLGMQYPPEIFGVTNINLLKTGIEKTSGKKMSLLSVYSDMLAITEKLRFSDTLLERDVNVGFSGGEKKKNELLHSIALKPKFTLLDEVDSGLDVDSINAIGKLINQEKEKNKCYIIISHYKKMFEIIKPDKCIIIKNGKVEKIGDYNFLMKTLEKGFDFA